LLSHFLHKNFLCCPNKGSDQHISIKRRNRHRP
jgi:hypothetical protein